MKDVCLACVDRSKKPTPCRVFLFCVSSMPLLRKQKVDLAKVYLSQLQQAQNIVVLSMKGIPVNAMSSVRMDLNGAEGQLLVVKKRVLAKTLGSEFEAVPVETLEGSIAVLYTHNETDAYAPLKVINKWKKNWKKEKLEYGFEYIGGWYDKQRKDGAFVGAIADLPTKEELVGKLLFLLNHPVSSFARAIQAIADKQGGGVVAEAAKIEEPKAEEVKTEEPKVEETPNEETKTEDIVSEETAPAEATNEVASEAVNEEVVSEGEETA